jgi:putative membrane protein
MNSDPTPAPAAGGSSRAASPPQNEAAVRDHLANERTYLAWLRTGMALLGLGFLAARWRIELGQVAPAAMHPGWLRGSAVGLGFAILGLVTVVFATWRYVSVRRMIEECRFTPLGAGVVAISTAALILAIVVILYLLDQML